MTESSRAWAVSCQTNELCARFFLEVQHVFAQNKKPLKMLQIGDFSPSDLRRNVVTSLCRAAVIQTAESITSQAEKINLKVSHPLYLCLLAAPLHCTPLWHEGRQNLSHAYGWRVEHSLAIPEEGRLKIFHISFSRSRNFISCRLLHWGFFTDRGRAQPRHSWWIAHIIFSSSPPQLIRLNIHSWGDCMSHYNSMGVTFTASLPRATCKI